MTEYSQPPRSSTARSNIAREFTAPVGDGAQTRRSLEQTVPWKYVGYRGYSRFISSDDGFFILRRFSVLNVRVSLALQNQLVMLERQLNELDNKYEGEAQIHNGRFEGDEKDREELISCIAEKLGKYNELVLQQSALRSYKPAPSQNIKNIFRWHANHGNRAICENEQQYLHYGAMHGHPNGYENACPETEATRKTRTEDDLICVVQKEKPPLRRVIDRSRIFRSMSLWEKKRENVSAHDMKNVLYVSEQRLDLFVSLITTMIGLAMLVTPLWILQSTTNLQSKLIVITVFIVVFLLVLSFGMVARPFEALGATAAYAAILMVFM
ncbi:hypothetical protein N5P37_010524 [Trichoderma harzianum]|uniref:DUF6594 domain-containing protein n=1 Tax=Trichoderma harzianum CBS 226.95 TaxID=983964 RepID=A0A2T4A0J1_TRIHA|nr:hypothetical protein M431DRAFT_485945 [Trichoderma harzianum CBS 226.95]KAK0756999.1 hypothetical protein N5P37_010524 [Trichoderma harzianum]PTB50584.1 hypothetical protein M431DRAFT_485945 [Trichoderma harzianum CBS 226.95]